ncbi:hypothetical protein CCP4SC76_7920007 [Gammaproteobacteria bacterium]
MISFPSPYRTAITKRLNQTLPASLSHNDDSEWTCRLSRDRQARRYIHLQFKATEGGDHAHHGVGRWRFSRRWLVLSKSQKSENRFGEMT